MKRPGPSLISSAVPKLPCSLLLFSLLVFAGCSVNQYGLPETVKKEERPNTCGKTVTLTAYGIHLYTEPNPGLQIGMRKLEMTYAQVSSPSQISRCNTFLAPEDLPPEKNAGAGKSPTPIAYASVPMHTDAESAGLGLDLSPHSLTLSLGIRRKRLLKIGQTQEIIFCYETGNASRTSGAISPEKRRRE